jgi:hypothetical protein
MSASPDSPRLQLTAISKRYPGCLANDRIDLTIAPGEIRALLGENGAGKSTLMKIIYGVTQPSSGEIRWQGERLAMRDPAMARGLLLAQRQLEAAGQALDKTTALNPNEFAAYLMQAHLALARDDVDEADRLGRLAARVEPLGVSGATVISVHHDSSGGAAMVGRAVTGRGENWYHGQGTGTPSATPYSDSAPHRTPATTVSAAVERTSTALATRLAAGLKTIHTSANGASGTFNGLVGRNDYVRMNHFYGYYRTTAQARVLVEVGAAPEDNAFLKRTDLISKTLSDAIIADLKARKLL